MAFSRSDIDVALVRRLVAAQFPQWAELPVEPVGLQGWDNRSFRLGDRMLVRLPSAEMYAAQVAKEQLWLPRLAAQLPLPVPAPLAMGAPGEGYPWSWSIYRWLEGEPAEVAAIEDVPRCASDLAGFLKALHAIDPKGGPEPGAHNFHRGGSLQIYDAETRDALAVLDGKVDSAACTAVWASALSAAWCGVPVWLHGDFAASNVLVCDGRLCAVIDFGCAGVGDPACDLVIAWTFLSGEGRAAFRSHLTLDDGCWARARGWALWKALITLAHTKASAAATQQAQRVLASVCDEHELGTPR